VLSDAEERALLDGEIEGLREAERVYGEAGAGDRAAGARGAAQLLADVLASVSASGAHSSEPR
jgi:hypothetical protein